MVNALEPQLQNVQQIKAVIKEVDCHFECAEGHKLKTLLVYLPIEGGETCHDLFFKEIKDGILSNFVFSCTEVERKLGITNGDAKEALFDKAIRKLSKHTAKGELGELILFTLLDVYFRAPKLLSKVAMKTNPRMPVFGADAVHGQFEGDGFTLFLGESKLHKDFKNAAGSAATSIQNAMAKYEDEFDLLDSFMDFPGIDDQLQEQLLALLNPFANKEVCKAIHSPCFIGFAQPDLISGADSDEEFVENYLELAKSYVAEFFTQVGSGDLSADSASLLLLPFSDVDQLVDEFIEYMGIKN